jgi:hypothetical protein
MLRKLFAGHRIACVPFADPDGTRGYDFEAEGTYAALLTGRRIVNGWCPRGVFPTRDHLRRRGAGSPGGGWSPRGDWHLLLGSSGGRGHLKSL